MSLLLPIVVGICVGIIVGLLGAGGGILSVPILVYLLGQSPHNAAAGSLLIVGATSLIALIGRRKEVHWKQGAVFGALSITGSFIGSFLNSLVSPNLLMYLFSSLLVVVAGLMFRKAAKEKMRPVGMRPEGSSKRNLLIRTDITKFVIDLPKEMKTPPAPSLTYITGLPLFLQPF